MGYRLDPRNGDHISTRIESTRPSMIHLIQKMGGDMRRDDELIRSLLLEAEADPSPTMFYLPDAEAGFEEWHRYYHLRLLCDAGMMEEMGRFGGTFRITNDGYDFLGMIREDTAWRRIKRRSGKAVADAGIRLMFEIGHEAVRQKLREAGLLS